jgi:hypothetical protein
MARRGGKLRFVLLWIFVDPSSQLGDAGARETLAIGDRIAFTPPLLAPPRDAKA